MKKKNISILLAAAAVAVACSDNSDNASVVPTPGVDVEFGATLDQSDASTRTYYGNEETATGSSSEFPILWQAGDIVRIISPECQSTFQDRNYQVDSDHEGKNYAAELNKTTDTGLRWGDAATASFYSIYPASGVTATDISNKTFTLTMPAEQTDTVRTVDGTKVTGTTTYTCRPQMDGCFMYARTTDVTANTTVNLRYKPLSTAIRFTLTGTANSTQSVTIQKVTLHAPQGTYIAGNFTVDLSGDGTPSVTVDESNASNEVVLTAIHENTTNAYLTLKPNETVELNAFIIPQEHVSISNGWYIEVQYNNGDKYQLPLNGTATSGKTMTLTAGMIHRLADFPNLPDPSEWNPNNWMTNVARNVYLSELSIPGSWNTLNSDFQGTDDSDTDIASQWSLGCRAFHFDTRWRTNKHPSWGQDFGDESDITVDALAVADKSGTYNYGSSIGSDAPKVMRPATPSFVDRLKEVVTQIKNNEEEYAVVVCSFAQSSYPEDDEDSDDDNGRSPNYGDMAGKTWMQAISEACKDEDVADYIYDARNLTPNTVVGDVLGKIIVIVCCDYAIPKLTLPTSSKCIFTYAPQNLTQAMVETDYNESALYVSSTSTTTTGIKFYSTLAQVTSNTNSAYSTDRGYAPTLNQRQTQVGNILTESKNNFDKDPYNHDFWPFLGLGGYKYEKVLLTYKIPNDGYTGIASSLNGWFSGKVEDMGTDKNYYPVGLVLMNFVPDYTNLVKEIYQLNTKYQMSHDPNKSSTSGTSSSAKARK